MSLTRQNSFRDVIGELMDLLVQLGGVGIINPSVDAPPHYDSSMKITAPLSVHIMEQSHQ